MSVLVLKERGKIVAAYRTPDDLFNDWPGKSWTPTGEEGWVDGHGLMAEAVPWYEHVVPVHERGRRAPRRVQTVPGRMTFSVLEKSAK